MQLIQYSKYKEKEENRKTEQIEIICEICQNYMIIPQSTLQKIRSEQKNLNGDTIQSRLQKIKFYMQNSSNVVPKLTADQFTKSRISKQLRTYFKSKEIYFFRDVKAPVSYFEEKQFQSDIQNVFEQFLKVHSQNQKSERQKQSNQKDEKQSVQSKKETEKPGSDRQKGLKVDFLQFIQFWVKNQHFYVFSESQSDVIEKQVKNYVGTLSGSVSENVSRQNTPISNRKTNQQVKNNKIAAQKQSEKSAKKNEPTQIKEIRKSDRSAKKSLQEQIQEKKQQQPKNQDYEQEYEQQPDFNQDQESHQSIQRSSKRSSKRSKKSHDFKEKDQDQSQGQEQQNQNNAKSQVFDEPIQKKTYHSFEQPKDSFKYYIKKFYEHYCKKYVSTVKNQEFEKLEHFYSSMNLTKWMMYCKDMKLLKLTKSITAKYLQTLFKTHENTQHCLELEAFQRNVKQILEVAFQKPEIIETQGYEQIGVSNRQNFASVMGKLGVKVPLKKIIFAKADEARELSRMVKSRTKQETLNMKQSRLLKQSCIGGKEINFGQGHGHQSNWDSNKLHPDLFLNEKQRKQQRLLQSLTIPKLNKLQPSRQMDQKLHEIIDEQYDPYLKRYNDRNNVSIHDDKGHHGVIKRMDERIQNVVKKIR